MLNRRVLRVKAMQAIYAYEQCAQSNYHLAIDHIDAKFELDWSVTESKSTAQIKAERELAVQIFKDNFQASIIQTNGTDVPDVVRQATISGLHFYKQSLKRDFEYFRNEMIAHAEQVYVQYLEMLALFVALAEYTETDFIARQKRQIGEHFVFEHERKLAQNFIVTRVKEHERFQYLLRLHNITWEKSTIATWYKLLQKDEIFIKYRNLSQATQEQEREIADYISRQFILKNELVVAHFEDQNLYWTEDQVALKSMLVKTIRAFSDLEKKDVILQNLSKNWETDKIFFRDLYTHTIHNDTEYATLVSQKLQNWAIERITQVDRIVLKMAVTEMIHFPSIPVKATINEYIELAKGYSTARSKQFINGVLDAIALDLTQKGRIKKSGRGLIDSK